MPSEFDDGYSDFSTDVIGEWPQDWAYEPDTVVVRLPADDLELLREWLVERKQQRERARQEGMKAFFASLPPAKPLPTVEENLAGIMRIIEQGKQRAAAQSPIYQLLSGMKQCSS